ncbi:TRAP transporter small permease [Allosalinactinospora lopnorensis]|uniref:TRAP transporter small permease n=1 Tax=Allosalinactinospora lopnorensis TaxID=1352348 RepID=UPI000623CEAE|nr:TRAP transporter small permease [Allosalinactinospora lopnorensis]
MTSTDPDSDEEPEPLGFVESRSRTMRLLMRAERILAVALLAALFGLVVFQVVSRYLLGAPLVWTEELARYTLVWLTFLGAGLIMARRRHITARLFSHLLGPRSTAVLEITANLVVIGVSALLVVAGWQFASTLARVDSPAAGLSLGWVYGASVLGFALVCLHACVNTAVAWRHPETLRDDAALAEGA